MDTVTANARTLPERPLPANAHKSDRWSTLAAVIAITLSSLGLWAVIWWAATLLISRL